MPGIGKSYILSVIERDPRPIQNGIDIEKIKNLLKGLNVANIFLIAMIFSGLNKKGSLSCYKSIAVLIERIGRVKRNKSGGILDEGIAQAIWGIFLRSNVDKVFIEKILSYLLEQDILQGSVIYIYMSKATHKKQIYDNPKSYNYKTEAMYKKGRRIMSMILHKLRNSDITILKMKNKRIK